MSKGLNRTGPNRAGLNKTGLNRTGLNRTGLNRTGLNSSTIVWALLELSDVFFNPPESFFVRRHLSLYSFCKSCDLLLEQLKRVLFWHRRREYDHRRYSQPSHARGNYFAQHTYLPTIYNITIMSLLYNIYFIVCAALTCQPAAT